jgi:AbrB family looped-hinge helix DNA binding protein
MVRARITAKGQVTVPKEIRDRLGVGPGDDLDFEFAGERLEVRPIRRRRLAEFRGTFRVDRALDFADERERARRALAEHVFGVSDPTDA